MNDLISRKWLMECVNEGWIKFDTEKDKNTYVHLVRDIAPSAQPEVLACGEGELSAQPEIIRCKDCIYYDPPHVENNGVRCEYDEMPADAFDALGTGLVSVEYGINVGGRCCADYYCKNYSDDKRVFVREDNYCGRAERRTDDSISD